MKSIVGFILLLKINNMAYGNTHEYWKADCTTSSINSTFQIDDPNPLTYEDNCSSEDFDWSLKLITPKKLEYELFFKIGATCKFFSIRKNKELESVECVNNIPAIYELPLEGDIQTLKTKLNEKYGKIVKISKNTFYQNATVEYSLYEKKNTNYVILKKTTTKLVYSEKSETEYKIIYINPTELNKWLVAYEKKINLENNDLKRQKNKSTNNELDKIK